MKKIVAVLILIMSLASCNHNAVEKPDKLIDEDVMVDILYDLSIMEAVKSQNPYAPQNESMNPKDFIFRKYKIDSLQFTESNRYYIAQIEEYKKMYDKVAERIENESKEAVAVPSTKDAHPISSGSEAGQVK
ncbi:DUF4296 domain-containing protein [Flavobacterium sp.]|uniref:DUF4296 domain-containing protein n=1 Tax=Flavobacterium sp. TaxID=239 RepID=UPI0026390237|nr:DUF4296 domain-containing protein [Flavobacterium sp.]